jgi:hypothetical protein
VAAPREFSDYVRTAEFHALQVERALRDAARRAPDELRERFAREQSENVKQLRQVLPAVRRA